MPGIETIAKELSWNGNSASIPCGKSPRRRLPWSRVIRYNPFTITYSSKTSLDTILAQLEKRKDVLSLSIADFQRALTLATIGVGENQVVTLSTAPEHLLSVAAKGEERQAEDQIPAQWSGSLPLRYSFNIQYLMDVVDSVKETTKGSEDTEDPHMALRFDVSEKDPTSTFAEVPGGVLVVMPIRE